jgi:hypothetical protein
MISYGGEELDSTTHYDYLNITSTNFTSPEGQERAFSLRNKLDSEFDGILPRSED